MNLLTTLDWMRVNHDRRVPDGRIPALSLLDQLAEDGNLPDGIDPSDLVTWDRLPDGDPAFQLASTASAWVGPAGPPPPAPAPSSPDARPTTWLESHDLGDGRRILLPGENMHDRSLSFVHEETADPRPRVMSLLIGKLNRIVAVAFSRRRQCQVDRTANGGATCIGVAGGCICAMTRGLEGSTEVYICECLHS